MLDRVCKYSDKDSNCVKERIGVHSTNVKVVIGDHLKNCSKTVRPS